MRFRLGGVIGAGGRVLSLAFVVLLISAELGGITYRKDCPTPQGTVSKDWNFQWFIPIPYVFRPSAPGCAIHTGTRVALNAVGVFRFSDDAGQIAKVTFRGSTDPGTQYYAGVYAVFTELGRYIRAGGLLQAPAAALPSEEATLQSLRPPAYVSSAHAELVREFATFVRDIQEGRAAQTRGDQAAVQALDLRTRPDFTTLVATEERIRLAVVAHASPSSTKP